MQDAGIFDGDILIVDRAVLPQNGDVVIAEVAGGFLIRHYFFQDGQGVLLTPDFERFHFMFLRRIYIFKITSSETLQTPDKELYTFEIPILCSPPPFPRRKRQ
jgi:Peptidase S24-like